MAEEYHFKAEGHKSIYTDNPTEREYDIYFSTPSAGVNEDTGILLLIAGFGGHSNSKVYKKMRNQFADEYNLVTVQCDYFGYEFMQEIKDVKTDAFFNEDFIKYLTHNLGTDVLGEIYSGAKVDVNLLLEHLKYFDITLELKVNLNETLSNFNDMSLMQAVDNITAVLLVMNILYDNDLSFNALKVIAYGNSHGAYLAYLSNAMTEGFFTGIIDNSSWLYPAYKKEGFGRNLIGKMTNMSLVFFYDYLANTIESDSELSNIGYFYKNTDFDCQIVAFYGCDDEFCSSEYKEEFLSLFKKNIKYKICEEDIDGHIFKSTKHGLEANYIELFKLAFTQTNMTFKKSNKFKLPQAVTYTTNKSIAVINYSKIVPQIFLKTLNNPL